MAPSVPPALETMPYQRFPASLLTHSVILTHRSPHPLIPPDLQESQEAILIDWHNPIRRSFSVVRAEQGVEPITNPTSLHIPGVKVLIFQAFSNDKGC